MGPEEREQQMHEAELARINAETEEKKEHAALLSERARLTRAQADHLIAETALIA